MTEPSRRFSLASGFVILLALGVVGYFVWSTTTADDDIAERQQRAQDAVGAIGSTARDTPAAATEPSTVQTGPVAQPGEVVVIHRVPGDDYGRLAIRHADGRRTLLDRSCMRVDISSGNGICLSEDDRMVDSYTSTFFDATVPDLTEIKSYSTPLPSRARVSSDGSLASATGFIDGDTYEDLGSGINTIVTLDSFDSTLPLIGLNQFKVEASDAEYNGPGRTFWGVTFVDNNEFYVTGLFTDTALILHGSIADRSMELTGIEGSCPSVSPDRETLVYKRSRDEGGFDLVAVDLAAGDTWTLGETRSVDDQVAWFDNDTILYALHPDEENEAEEGDTQPEFDVWKLDITEGAEPELFLLDADSPTMID